MANHEKDPFAFDPNEVVGEDMNVLKFQIPGEAAKKLAGFVLADTEVNAGE